MRGRVTDYRRNLGRRVIAFCVVASFIILMLERRVLQADPLTETGVIPKTNGNVEIIVHDTQWGPPKQIIDDDDGVYIPSGDEDEESEELDEDEEEEEERPPKTPDGGGPKKPDETAVDKPKDKPISEEKRIQKEKELAEKERLERLVRQEYEDELAGKQSMVRPRNISNGLKIPKPLLFLHIPKTAGSTLGQVFKSNEDPNKYYHFWSQPRLSELHIVPKKDTIFGHFRYGLHFYLNSSTVSYATMLREPVSRVISYYHFHLQDTQDPAHEFAVTHSFEEWLEVSQGAQNEMTKCLSGIRSEFVPSQESFAMAKHHLRNMAFVGLTEHFEESLLLMKYYFGWKDLDFQKTKVGSKKPKELSADIIELIKEKNRMDIELYEMAKEIFEEELAEVGQHLWHQDVKKTFGDD